MHLFERGALLYGPAPGALWEDSALTQVPSETSGGQCCAMDEGRKEKMAVFLFHLDLEAALDAILLKTDLSVSSASLSG